MRKNILHVLALGAALALAGCLGADSPEEQLKSIEEMQAKNNPMTAEQKSGLEASLAKGREALAAGNKEAAGAAFGEALDILKKAEDMAMFNKSE